MEGNHIKNISFNITGFKPFGSITQNPTMHIVEYLQQNQNKYPDLVFNDLRVLEVSIDTVDSYFKEMNQNLTQKTNENKNVLQIVLNFGVYQGSDKFQLENKGINYANFCIPDNKGNQLKACKVIQDNQLKHTYTCNLPLAEMQAKLSKKHKVIVSEDAGDFVCNYTYYTALNTCKDLNIPALFVHFPAFQQINFETQIDFVIELIRLIKQVCIPNFKSKQN